jgi:ParB family chromosome partitioning protein
MTDPVATAAERLESITVDKLHLHPRVRAHDSEKLTELTSSIKEHGQLQPARGRPKDGAIEIYIGCGRYQACFALGRPLQVLIADKTDEQVDLEMLHENLKREELDPITEARDYKYMMDLYHWSQGEMAQKAGKSQQSISNCLSLLSLCQEVQELTKRLVISETHGILISKIDDEGLQAGVAKEVVEGHLTTDQTAQLVEHVLQSRNNGSADSSVPTDQPKPKAAVKDLASFWPNLPDGVLAKLEKGWLTLRWPPNRFPQPKVVLQEILNSAPESLPVGKAKKNASEGQRMDPPLTTAGDDVKAQAVGNEQEKVAVGNDGNGGV